MPDELRMRVFAGPNGSGKSTIIKSVREYIIEDRPIDFGIYINADDIANELRNGKFSFQHYHVNPNKLQFTNVAAQSGLLIDNKSIKFFEESFDIKGSKVVLKDTKADERLAQIIADFLRKELIADKRKLSFETVFSHPSKLDIMRQAKEEGYKVYLYFVSTEGPEINKYRVNLRVKEKGHNVPPDKIASRYYRSLDQLYDAAQLAYQAYFFDNSGERPALFAHFKQVDGVKTWDGLNPSDTPAWFAKYYSGKVAR